VKSISENNTGNEESITVTVQPSTNPLNDKDDVAHFFSEEASSSFVVKRVEKKITAGVFGRNEKPNTEAESFIDKARNVAVAAGALSGFSKLQWKSLVNGIMEE
jgi:tellurite resistance protein